jgi:hypothetical protein
MAPDMGYDAAMRALVALCAMGVVASCGPVRPPLPPGAERLHDDDLITREMCAQMVGWMFDNLEHRIPARVYRATSVGTDSVGLRTRLERGRAEALSDKNLVRCSEVTIVKQYRCVLGTRDPEEHLRCLEDRALVANATLRGVLLPLDETWLELETDHFQLWTDLPAAEAAALARRLEDTRAVILTVFFGRGDVAVARSRVVAPGTLSEWRRYSDAGDVLGQAYAAERSPFGEPLLVISPGRGDVVADTVTIHELVHLVTSAVIAHQPRWFAEGIATFFETAVIDRAAGQVLVGRTPERLADVLFAQRGVPLGALIGGLRDHDGASAAYYASSFQLVAYLLARHEREFATYQRLLKQVRPIDHLNAWRSAFPSLPPETLQSIVHRWWFDSGPRPFIVKLPPAPQVAVRQQPLAAADAYTVRALLYLLLSDGRSADARLNVEAALRASTQHLMANVLALLFDGLRPDSARARAIVDAQQDEWMAWALLMQTLPANDPERETARREACERLAGRSAENTLLKVTCPP